MASKVDVSHREIYDRLMAVEQKVDKIDKATSDVVTAFDARVSPAFLKQAWQGKLVLSGALKIDATRNAVVLTEPRLENLSLDAATGSNAGKLAKLGTQLAEDLLNNTVIYTFKPEDFFIAGMRFAPTKITTRANALVVSFEPLK